MGRTARSAVCLGLIGILVAMGPCTALLTGDPFLDLCSNEGTYGVNEFLSSGSSGVTTMAPLNSSVGPGLRYSSYLGGQDIDDVLASTIDDGNRYIVGATRSYDFPTTTGAFNRSLNGIDGGIYRDGFITVIDRNGSLKASTFLGGDRRDLVSDIELLSSGDVLVVGYTNSTNLQTTPSALNTSFNGGERDVFIALLDANLTQVKHATYFGGTGYDGSATLAVGDDGSVYVCGETNSADLPTSQDVYQPVLSDSGGETDLFVARFSATLDELTFCTYFGGRGNDTRPICDIDPEGNVVVSGLTDSDDVPVSSGAYDTIAAGNNESYVAVISKDGKSRLACTYIGGDGSDRIAAVIVDRSDGVYITGATNSKDWDFDGLNGPNPARLPKVDMNDSFVMALDSDLSICTFGTFLGGSEGDRGLDITLDNAEKNLYFIGMTRSTDVQMNCTKGAYDNKFRGGNTDLFITAINLSDNSITYMSLFGGRENEQVTLTAQVLDVDADGVMHFAFESMSNDVPTTMGAYCRTFGGGGYDIVVASLNPVPCPVPDPLNVTAAEGKGWINFTWDMPTYEMCRLDSVKVFKGIMPDDSTKLREAVPLGISYFNETIAIQRNITHYFWFRLKNTAGLSELQDPIEWLPLEKPTVPLDLVAISGDSTVLLNWSRPFDDGGEISGHHLFRGPDNESVDELIATLGPDVQSYHDTKDLENGSTYHYSVRAFNVKHNGSLAHTRSLVWGPPAVPRLVEGDPGDTNVSLSWRQPFSEGGINISGYRVWRSTNLANWTLTPGPVGTGTVYTDVNRVNNVTYYYRVAAYHDRAEGPNVTTEGYTPFGKPGPPENLTVIPGEGMITIRWTPPLDGNGMDPTSYIIYYGTDVMYLNSSMSSVNTFKEHQVPKLNVTYYYMVKAKNDAGESISTEKLSSLALDKPGSPTDFEANWDIEGVLLTWRRPADDGGHGLLRFDVYRLTSGGGFVNIGNVTNMNEYLDKDVNWGMNYSYYLKVNNTRYESDPTEIETFPYTTIPGKVTTLTVDQESTYVKISWDYPAMNGGEKVTKFELFRYSIDENMVEEKWNSSALFYLNDTHYGLIPGRDYSYKVKARNDNGWGPWSDDVTIIFRNLPPAPIVSANVIDREYIEVNWTIPDRANCSECKWFEVFKGTPKDELILVANVTGGYIWTDYAVEEGGTYYYQVIAQSDIGPSNPSEVYEIEVDGRDPWVSNTTIMILIIVILVIIGTAFIVVSRGRREMAEEETVPEPTPEEVSAEAVETIPIPPWSKPEPATAAAAPAAISAAAPAEEPGLLTYIVEEVFVVYNDGRLITSCAREECGTADADLMSGMLIAIQGLIQDGLESGGTLEQIKYGENLISLASSDHVVLAAVVYGKPDDQLQEDLKKTVSNIEGTYAGIIEDWTGEPSAMEGLDGLVMPLIDKTAYLTRDNVGDVLADHGVALLSAVDFYRGYVRLKMAAVNATFETIIDSAVEIHYDSDMLRMERVEPDSIIVRGDRTVFGNILPGERKTVALLFDPQICQSTHMDGHLSYYDSRGELRYVEMKRRTADVVCPVFFTRENANTAMLRRLMKETLHQYDLRIYRYPSTLSPREVLQVSKQALGSDEIQLVREYITESPAFEAEVWYYAETKVKGYQFVIRLGVVADKGVVELFAACTAMEPITGLLADFRRGLNHVLEERYAEETRMEVERDEQVRRDLERRPLRLDASSDD